MTSRRRERSEPASDFVFQPMQVWWDGSQHVGDPPVEHHYCTAKGEIMSDLYKVPSQVKVRTSLKVVTMRAMKPVSHMKWTAALVHNPVPVIFEAPKPYRGSTIWAADSRLSFVLRTNSLSYSWQDLGRFAANSLLSHAVTSAGSDVFQGHHDRWNAVRPTMATRANLTTFLYELREFTQLWKVLPKKHFSLDNWPDVLSYANGLHLNYNFGWKPFLGDLKRIFRGVDQFSARLQKFVAQQNLDLRRRRRDAPVSGSFDVSYTLGIPVTDLFRFQGSYTVHRSSAFDFVYSLPQMSWDALYRRAWLDTLGLQLNPANIWAVVPWSFVVDWFTDVGGWLDDQYTTDWVEPSVDLFQALSTMKISGTGSVSWVTPTYDGSRVLPAVTCNFSSFNRRLGMPRFGMDTPPLSADKIRLGSSLALSRILPR